MGRKAAKAPPLSREFVRGVLAAAAVADEYNGSSTHLYRLGDCIAMKLNVTRRRYPRLNEKRIEDPKAAQAGGMALALAEIYRLAGCTSAVCAVAADARLTIAEMKRSGVDPYDWKALKRAGVR